MMKRSACKRRVMNKVAAIIVTYQPNQEDLNNLIDILSPQVTGIYIVDNASFERICTPDKYEVKVISLSENMGIACAQNIGLNAARSDGYCDYILFDQDSFPSETMVDTLLLTRNQALLAGIKVGAVGPVHIDQDSFSESYFIRTNRYNLIRVTKDTENNREKRYAVCDFLIASGCLFSESSLNDIGNMEERLFIDCVDIEWGFRALSKGYQCIAAFDADMFHKIGGPPLRLFGRDLTTHSPIRHYYFYRNFYHMCKRSYVPSVWKRHVFIKSTIQAFVFVLFLSPRLSHLKAIFKGVLHARRGRYGK